MGGYFYGITTGMNTKNVALRRSQFRLADSDVLNHRVEIVEGVLASECTTLMRNFFNSRR